MGVGMVLIQSLVSVLYYLLVAFVVVLLIWNFMKVGRPSEVPGADGGPGIPKSLRWQEELLYVIVLIPFLLRLFRLK